MRWMRSGDEQLQGKTVPEGRMSRQKGKEKGKRGFLKKNKPDPKIGLGETRVI